MRKQIQRIIAFLLAVTTTTVMVNAYDLRTVTDITDEQLEPYMHPETRHLALQVVDICNEEGVSVEFIATLMRWERRPDTHNWFGWRLDNGQYAVYSSDTDCLEEVIPLIKSKYLTEGGEWYGGGYDVAAVSKRYCDTDVWRQEIEAGTLSIVDGVEQDG